MNTFEIKKENSIGVFDSGVGGIGVLKELVQILPNENFIFYGDSLNTPYGEKTPEHILQLVNHIVQHLLEQKVKAIVIACNTATSVAAEYLRQKYPEISIIGMEPAIKMGISEEKKNKVLVMATPVTLHLDKYQKLQQKLETQAEFLPVECPGLAKRIESADFDGEDLLDMLKNLLEPYKGKIDNVVCGCTHYPFLRKQIQKILGEIPVYDGGHGTALQLKRVLEGKDLLTEQTELGTITYESSKGTAEELELYKRLYQLYEVY